MQISACIICKNEEQYIGKCIQALRALPVHIVAADTGSTDNTLSILERHRLIGSGWWTLMRS